MMRILLALFYLFLLISPVLAGEPPTSLKISGQTVQLQVFAWRDFMPQIGGDGSGSDLMLVPSLVDHKGTKINGVSFDQIIALYNGKSWNAKVDSGGTARGGPKWPPGSGILVKAHYLYKGQTGWIRLAKPTPIQQTE